MGHQQSSSLIGRSSLSARMAVAALLAVAGLGLALLVAPLTGGLASLAPTVGAQSACPPGQVSRGICFPNGAASFADATIEFIPGENRGPGAHNDLTSVLDPPDDFTQAGGGESATDNSLSVGDGGVLVVQFIDNVLTGSGTPDADLWIFETGDEHEVVVVEVSADGTTWTELGSTSSQNAGFDLDAFGFDQSSQLYCVRVTDDPDDGAGLPGGHRGADIDAIGAITTIATSGTCNGLVATITGAGEIDGGSRHDVIVGSPGNDVIDGSSGHDTICGNGGNDVIEGGSGHDWMFGAGTLDGSSGNDTITASGAGSTIDGGSGNDTCTGTATIEDCEG